MLKNLFYLFCVAVASLMMLSSCGYTGAPDCADKDVQERVIDDLTNPMKTAMAKITDLAGKRNKQIPEEKLKSAQDFLDSFKLLDIKTIPRDDSINECKCSANIVISGKLDDKSLRAETYPIKYTIQHTKDGLRVRFDEIDPRFGLLIAPNGQLVGPGGNLE